jgi:hypothetical protein
MDELTDKVARHRRRIRLARAADAALRWSFYASVAGCFALAVMRFAGLSLPAALAGALLAVPAAMAIREWSRTFSVRDCAIHLDRLLGLEERLSTAMEVTGPLGPMVKADAAAAIRRSVLPARRLPREAALLGGSLLLAATLAVLPSPERSGARGDRALEVVAAEQAAKLESLANVDVQFQELAQQAARELRAGRPEQSLAILEELRRKLEERLLEGGPSAPAAQALLDQASASVAAVSAELGRLGRIVHAPPPAVPQAKLQRQRTGDAAATVPSAVSVDSASAVVSQDVPWPPRYDPVVRRYLGN